MLANIIFLVFFVIAYVAIGFFVDTSKCINKTFALNVGLVIGVAVTSIAFVLDILFT